MNREQQDLNWRCLPKESREGIKAYHRENKAFSNKSSMCNSVAIAVENIFGHHNLTSGTEPEEMLMIPRYKVVVRYEDDKDVANTTRKEDTRLLCETRMNLLANLFGNKCLPDTPNSSNLSNIGKDELEHRLEPTVQESVQVKSKPKFKVGDKVRVIEEGIYKGFITEVIGIDESDEDCPYQIDSYRAFEEGRWFSDSDLEPYTESEKEVKEKQNLSLSDKQKVDNMEEKELRKEDNFPTKELTLSDEELDKIIFELIRMRDNRRENDRQLKEILIKFHEKQEEK